MLLQEEIMKNTDAKDLIERYVYAVLRNVPFNRRGDIEKEIRMLIDDTIGKENPSMV
jgi:hypothetical protein